MNAYSIIFYLLAAFIIGNGVLAMTTRKIFRAAIFLLFSLIGVAGLYFWMHVEFVAAVQVIVYVGGIVVLIIFSIFLTQQTGKDMPRPTNTRMIFSALAAILGAALTYSLIRQYGFIGGSGDQFNVSPQRIGDQMLDYQDTGYALPFEVISILLLAAMIGCIVIALKSKPQES
ncbi:MAG TPA: NADH-quinone oxidoreductase subunit J [Chitinophagales bacterium]|nr:NADH-quinone oxidoreductase subunit J [Chitinophagales bacterium]HMX03389.1 NADH-quinone oxidoreductase subunit J [Chitinophagales bacterium]HMZ88352.1 NADH-quinone oxidoreductase subunit J [Chitinophagales bacterium]HNA57089.1 NADH-quinone oxidoreductase subunit J [Chitinophagales bacterium]HNE45365.1 NADH-quinone oxidoreductase subunit J [Chitinophagales bacterium]